MFNSKFAYPTFSCFIISPIYTQKLIKKIIGGILKLLYFCIVPPPNLKRHLTQALPMPVNHFVFFCHSNFAPILYLLRLILPLFHNLFCVFIDCPFYGSILPAWHRVSTFGLILNSILPSLDMPLCNYFRCE